MADQAKEEGGEEKKEEAKKEDPVPADDGEGEEGAEGIKSRASARSKASA